MTIRPSHLPSAEKLRRHPVRLLQGLRGRDRGRLLLHSAEKREEFGVKRDTHVRKSVLKTHAADIFAQQNFFLFEKEAGVGCGVSAKFDEAFYPRARRLIAARPYSSYAGFLIRFADGWRYDHM